MARLTLAVVMLIVGVVIIVSGFILYGLMVPQLEDEVAIHETIPANQQYANLGTYDLDGRAYKIWIEDYHHDGESHFTVELYDSQWEEAIEKPSSEDETMEIDGVMCRLEAHYIWITKDRWKLDYIHRDAEEFDPEDMVDVYIVRQHSVWTEWIINLGMVLIGVGVLVVVLALIKARADRSKGV